MNVRHPSIAFLLVTVAGSQVPARASLTPMSFPPARCFAVAPAKIRGPSVQWLGPCIAGKADGLGILRVGKVEPFAFLVGRMKAGRPLSGQMRYGDRNLIEAMAFDKSGEAIVADCEHVLEQERIGADAVKAARGVAALFEAVGNLGSATYYRRFADRIEHGRPE